MTSPLSILVAACIFGGAACANNPAPTPSTAGPALVPGATSAAAAPLPPSGAPEGMDAEAAVTSEQAPVQAATASAAEAGAVANASGSSCEPPPAPRGERLVLARTNCFGACPAYSVEVRRDGTVVFEGNDFVRVHGKVCGTIPKSKATALFDEASRAHLSGLKASYRVPITDNPSAIVTLQLAGAAAVTIDDYPPCHTDDPRTPAALCKLEKSIDRVADTSKWITCPARDDGTAECAR